MDALFADLEQARDAWAGLYDLFVQAKYEVAGARTLDEIDTVFAEHYGFTHEELDFILNYDIKYRPRPQH